MSGCGPWNRPLTTMPYLILVTPGMNRTMELTYKYKEGCYRAGNDVVSCRLSSKVHSVEPFGAGFSLLVGRIMRKLLATTCALACWRLRREGSTSGSAHICRALIEPVNGTIRTKEGRKEDHIPHSIIFRSSHCNLTGLLRKSLHPAASAATRSCGDDCAVNATMMTDE